jgi:hypothetical protein
MRWMGLIAFIPTAGFLTISFFVLFAVEKVNGKNLKTFGKAVAAILIIAALLIFSKGVYTLVTGKCPIMNVIQGMCGTWPGPVSDMGDKCGGMMKSGVQGESGTCPLIHGK